MPLSTIIIQHQGIGWALCWHNLQIAWDQPKKTNNKQNNKQPTLRVFYFSLCISIKYSMQRIWHHDRTMNEGSNCEISYVWYDGTNFNYEYCYYEHSPSICVLPTFTINTVILCLQQCHHIRTHEWCMYSNRWMILLFHCYSSCYLLLFHCCTGFNCQGSGRRVNMIFTPHIVHPSPFNKYTIDHPKLHSKLCFGSNNLRWLIHLFISKKRKFGPGLGLSIKVPDCAHIRRCVSGGEHDQCLHMKYHHSRSDEGAESGNSANENVSAPLWYHHHRHRWHFHNIHKRNSNHHNKDHWQ